MLTLMPNVIVTVVAEIFHAKLAAPKTYVGPEAKEIAPVVPEIVQFVLAPVAVIVPDPEQTIPVPLLTVKRNPFVVIDAVPETVTDFTVKSAVIIATALPVPLNTRSSVANSAPLPL